MKPIVKRKKEKEAKMVTNRMNLKKTVLKLLYSMPLSFEKTWIKKCLRPKEPALFHLNATRQNQSSITGGSLYSQALSQPITWTKSKKELTN
jgi:hypothetical protein